MAEVIVNENIQSVLPQRFLKYSEAVLKDRAIPSCFDGLKPIHRRVLLSFQGLHLMSNSPFKKSAKVVGDCLANWNPHGDISTYEALVGMAQDFNMRYPLVEGSGNFGDQDGSPPAAMRYSQCRLSPYGELMLEGVERLTEKQLNFDGSREEAKNLATFFPNLLLNPTSGIAVGLATKFAPHYAKDVYTAIIETLKCRKAGESIAIDELIKIIKAPDFPTGGVIINASEMANIYKTGRGAVTLRAKYRIEKNKIIYTEIPYKEKPCDIIKTIVGLNIADIKDIRDESSLDNGLRIVVELKKDANPDWIVNTLFKNTALQANYNVNMVAIKDERPVSNLSLKDIIEYYLDNIIKVHKLDLKLQADNLKRKITVYEYVLSAIFNIDAIIKILKESDTPIEKMQQELNFSKLQAEFIADMRLTSLSKASKEDITDKLVKEQDLLSITESYLNDNDKFYDNLIEKFTTIRDSRIFKNDKRRTEICNIISDSSADARDFVKNEWVVVTFTNKGAIKATRPDEYKTCKRNAVGVTTKLREDECICDIISNITTHHDLLLFSTFGRCYCLPVYKIPITSRSSSFKSINNFIKLMDGEEILRISVIPKDSADKYVLFVTKNGYLKRLALTELTNSTRLGTTGTKIINLVDDDKIKSVNICDAKADTVIFTSHGRGLKFNIDDEAKPVRIMGKAARGQRAIKLKDDENVITASILEKDSSLAVVTANGFGKRLNAESFKEQKLSQAPINYISNIRKTGKIVGGVCVKNNEDLLITTYLGQIVRIDINELKPSSRTAQGVKFINIKNEQDTVAGIAVSKKEERETIG